jgi:alkyl sulfatase BDS1-like metallo-beta-lactamase superfamily hydrolase
MHNVLTPRGALVRDAKAWADYLTESIRLYADQSDVMFAAHGIPRFGQGPLTRFLKKHRDAYKFLHDQSVRRMNAGETGAELAETLELPEVLSREWYNRGYYGTMSHNSKAVYQRYMGWYDANPASLWPYPPEESGRRYVEAMGGPAAVLARAEEAMSAGDYRWAVQLLNHAVFAGLADDMIRIRLVEAYTQLGYQAEAGTWRNIYLMGALELSGRAPSLPSGGQTASLDMIRATPTSMLLDLMAVRLDPAKADGVTLVINLELTDFTERHLITVENGVLIHETGFADPEAGLSISCARLDFLAAVMFGVAIDAKVASGEAKAAGDVSLLARFAGLLAAPIPDFPIVSP